VKAIMSAERTLDTGEPTGFAGLSRLISKIPEQVQPVASDGSRNSSSVSTTESISAQLPTTALKVQRDKPPKSQMFVVTALSLAGVLILWFFSRYDGHSPVVPASPPTYRDATPARDVTPAPLPSEPIEERPPIGTDLVLTRPQLRYCLAEKIRMDEMDRIVDTRSQRQVQGFNADVDDYNRRCSHFRYYNSVLDLARTEVEARRGALAREANRRVQAWK
jgi:hypothetical protein